MLDWVEGYLERFIALLDLCPSERPGSLATGWDLYRKTEEKGPGVHLVGQYSLWKYSDTVTGACELHSPDQFMEHFNVSPELAGCNVKFSVEMRQSGRKWAAKVHLSPPDQLQDMEEVILE